MNWQYAFHYILILLLWIQNWKKIYRLQMWLNTYYRGGSCCQWTMQSNKIKSGRVRAGEGRSICVSISLAICQKYFESKLPSNLLPRKFRLNFVISPFISTGLLLNSIRFRPQLAHSDNECFFGIVNGNVTAKSTDVTENCLVFTQIWLHVQLTCREMLIVHKIDGGQV